MQVDYQGHKTEAIPVDFIERKEGWNEYQLTDGKILRIKLVVTRILSLPNEKNQDGTPCYMMQSMNVVGPVE